MLMCFGLMVCSVTVVMEVSENNVFFISIFFDEFSVVTVYFQMQQADAGGSGIVSRRLTGQQSGADQFVMMIPNNKVY